MPIVLLSAATAIPDPGYLPPALDYLVGVLPTPALNDLGGGVLEIKFNRAKFQSQLFNLFKENVHYVVNASRCEAALITRKSSDILFYSLQVKLDDKDTWVNGDMLAPQFTPYIMHYSNVKMADVAARGRDNMMGWTDLGVWSLLKQQESFDPQDGQALGIKPGDDLSQTAQFDIQLVTASGQVVNICRSGDPNSPMAGLSDGKPPLEIRRRQNLTLRAALDIREDSRSKRKG